MLVGTIIYATDNGPLGIYKNFDLSAGFALVIVAAIFTIAGAVFMFISSADDEYHNRVGSSWKLPLISPFYTKKVKLLVVLKLEVGVSGCLETHLDMDRYETCVCLFCQMCHIYPTLNKNITYTL